MSTFELILCVSIGSIIGSALAAVFAFNSTLNKLEKMIQELKDRK